MVLITEMRAPEDGVGWQVVSVDENEQGRIVTVTVRSHSHECDFDTNLNKNIDRAALFLCLRFRIMHGGWYEHGQSLRSVPSMLYKVPKCAVSPSLPPPTHLPLAIGALPRYPVVPELD